MLLHNDRLWPTGKSENEIIRRLTNCHIMTIILTLNTSGVFVAISSPTSRIVRARSSVEEGGRGQGEDAGRPHLLIHPLLVSSFPGHSLHMELVLGTRKELHRAWSIKWNCYQRLICYFYLSWRLVSIFATVTASCCRSSNSLFTLLSGHRFTISYFVNKI